MIGIISYICAIRPILKGCEFYLSCIHDISKKSPPLDSIPIVSEFLDVFLTDLPDIPPTHEIEFSIDLESGTQTIFMAPYYMAPAKLKELNS